MELVFWSDLGAADGFIGRHGCSDVATGGHDANFTNPYTLAFQIYGVYVLPPISAILKKWCTDMGRTFIECKPPFSRRFVLRRTVWLVLRRTVRLFFGNWHIVSLQDIQADVSTSVIAYLNHQVTGYGILNSHARYGTNHG